MSTSLQAATRSFKFTAPSGEHLVLSISLRLRDLKPLSRRRLLPQAFPNTITVGTGVSKFTTSLKPSTVTIRQESATKMARATIDDFSGDQDLVLTEVEANLRRLLLDVANFINPEKPSELRYTGGWVRDKLLRIGSNDIDVAISDMTGYQFGLKMKEYLESSDTMAKYGIHGVAKDDNSDDSAKVVSGLHKIEANPEKSKHLETVTTKVFGLDIDLVNLRKETYTEESRTPQMEFGTAEEDALRRDATINAMFYNLQTGKVEDLTGRGLEDLKNKIVRTPLEPYQTFKDDPLRVLRLIRFASRLDYQVEEAAVEAMKDPSIKEALKAKISRERVGIELEKMLKGNDPHYALRMINDYGLYTIIFVDPNTNIDFEPDVKAWKATYDLALDMIQNGGDCISTLLPDEIHKYLAWVMSCITPWRDAPLLQPSKTNKRPTPFAVSVAREGFKAPNKVSDVINAAVLNREDITNTAHGVVEAQKRGRNIKALERDTLGMSIRRWGPSWRSQVLFSLFAELSDSERDAKEVVDTYRPLLTLVRDQGLLEAYDFKTLIDGKTLAKELDTKPGPWMKDALDVVMAWQLRNPSNTSIADAVQAVRDHNGELVASLVRHFLELTIRPLFLKTRPPDVTEQGYKSMTPVNPRERDRDMSDSFGDEKPSWKKEVQTCEILLWCSRVLHPQLTEKMWHLLIPPILRVLDDTETKYKVLGCKLLQNLLNATPPSLLKRTGLGQVFEDALTISLAFLPSLTPEQESISIQDAAYPALITLARVRFPSTAIQPRTPSTTESSSGLTNAATQTTDQPSTAKVKSIGITELPSTDPPSTETITTPNPPSTSKHPTPNQPHPQNELPSQAYLENMRLLLHKHLLPSITHTLDTNPALLSTLLYHLSTLISEMGTYSITQLKDILYLLQSLQIDRFVASGSPELLISTLKTMQVVLSCAWPRMQVWRGEVYKGLCGAWVNIEDTLLDSSGDGSEDGRKRRGLLEKAKREVRLCMEMVVGVCRVKLPKGTSDETIDVEAELASLLDAEPRLEGLLEDL